MQAYCLKCRDHRDITEAEEVTLKNGRPAIKGKCGTCGANVSRLGKATPEEEQVVIDRVTKELGESWVKYIYKPKAAPT